MAKGFKTILVNSIFLVLALLNSQLEHPIVEVSPAVITTVISVVNIALRLFTSTPALTSNPLESRSLLERLAFWK